MRKYTINGVTTAVSFSVHKQLCEYVSGAKSSGWVTHVKLDGAALTASDYVNIQLVRMHTLAASMTSFTPILLDPAGGIASGVGGAALTAVWTSGQTDGTIGDILWRRNVSSMAGGGVEVFFPDMMYEFEAGGAVDKGALGLWVANTLGTNTILEFELGICEIG